MFDSNLVQKALKMLDDKIRQNSKNKVRLLIGGGGALIAAHDFHGVTTDVDAVVIGGSLFDIEKEIIGVQRELNLPGDWINPHYSTFTIYLPSDYQTRAVRLYSGEYLLADVLGAEDLLIMKFMAGRTKDLPHIRFLIKSGADLGIVEKRLEELKKLFPDIARNALELFDEVAEELS